MPNSELGAIPGCLGEKEKRNIKDYQAITTFYEQNVQVQQQYYNHLIRAFVKLSLTRGVVGNVCSHWIRTWPSLVHHSMHAVHARAVWRACSHHALGHVRVARWPREDNACLERIFIKNEPQLADKTSSFSQRKLIFKI